MKNKNIIKSILEGGRHRQEMEEIGSSSVYVRVKTILEQEVHKINPSYKFDLSVKHGEATIIFYSKENRGTFYFEIIGNMLVITSLVLPKELLGNQITIKLLKRIKDELKVTKCRIVLTNHIESWKAIITKAGLQFIN